MGYSVLLLSTIFMGVFVHQMPLSHASFLRTSPTNEDGVNGSGNLQRRGNNIQRPPLSSSFLTPSNTHRHVQQNRNNESTSWLQIGSDIDGSLISLSDDGMRVVARASSSISGPGLIARVYEQDLNGDFIQIGNSIDYAMYDELFQVNGFISSIDISSDGKRVLVGTLEYNDIFRKFPFARIFEEVNGSWIQIGNAIEDDSSDDYYSTQSKISGDGKRIIVGSVWDRGNGDDEGHVRVFEEKNNRWVQVGEIANTDSSAKAGHDYSFDISMDGKRIITGVYFDPSYYSYDTGVARVFEEIDGTWAQVGADIEEFSGAFTSFSTSLSGNGKRLMVGANSKNRGDGFIARIFQEKNGEWVQVGSDIAGGEGTEFLDRLSVDLSGDGMSAVIGKIENDESAENAGRARIYKDINGSWIPVGNDIFGDKAGDRLGYSLSISGDGNRVAFKAGLITFQKLYSRVYELTTYTTTIAPQPTSAPNTTTLAPQPTSVPKGNKGKGNKGGKSSKAPKSPKTGKGGKGGKSSKAPKSPKTGKGGKGGKSSKSPKQGKGSKGGKSGKGGSSKAPKSSKSPKVKHLPKSSKASKSSKSGKSKSTKGRRL